MDREVDLAAERAAHGGLHHAHPVDRPPQHRGEFGPLVVHPLADRVEGHAGVVGHGHAGLGFDVGVLDQLGAEGPFDHDRGSAAMAAAVSPRSTCRWIIDVAVGEEGRGVGQHGLLGVEDAPGVPGRRLDEGAGPGGLGRRSRRRRRHRLTVEAHPVGGEEGLVLDDDAEAVAAGDVGRGDDRGHP